jgi:hypothetical protein
LNLSNFTIYIYVFEGSCCREWDGEGWLVLTSQSSEVNWV